MKSLISDSHFLILSRKAKTGGEPTAQEPWGEDGVFPERAGKEKSGVEWVGTGCENAHRMPLVRRPKNIPEEKAVSRCGSHRKEALVFHKARDRFA